MAKEWSIWSDLNNEFRTDLSGDLKIDYDEEAVETAVENILLTRVGERVMRPEFGSYLQRYLFEPVSEETAYRIGAEIYRALKQEERVEVDKVDVEYDEMRGIYVVKIQLRMKGLDKGMEIVRILTKI